MGKIASKYFVTSPWQVIEEGFDPAQVQVAESVFSLGNEIMGVRGFFEEGYSKDHLIGCYFNGVYERNKLPGSSYKGMIDSTEFMVNSVNWLDTMIVAEGEKLDLAVSDISDFRRVLDMKTGSLTREFVWKTKKGGSIKLRFERFLSMSYENIGCQRITFKSIGFSGKICVTLASDFGIIHKSFKENYWNVTERRADENGSFISAETKNTKQYLSTECRFETDASVEAVPFCEEKRVGISFTAHISDSEEKIFTRYAFNSTDKEAKAQFSLTYQQLLEENAAWWGDVWKNSDIRIEGDEDNQQGIRFCIFQMFQTYHGAREGNNIGAKGLTGEAYSGNAFWDTETYCLPFFLFQKPEAAKNLLMFRYRTLPQAKKRAKDLDCKGAFYPIATISGNECCNLWQHASLQLQASTGVAYGVWCYEKVTGDSEFLYKYGLEMLVEISRMLATRGDWSADRSQYGFYNVMGPDEFQMMVNHNCYTNVMGKFVFEYTLRSVDEFRKNDPDNCSELIKRLEVTEKEMKEWKSMADNMYVPYYPESGLFEQHEGFFRLPHIDIDAIPVEDFPLYHHWSYDHIYRNDMIKQPDVLMLMLLFNSSFTYKQLKANYEYYEPRCIHESSLSPSVHSILASQLGKTKDAFDFFHFATRMDLDNYNRNTGEGIHTTSIAAAWLNIIYGFAGMRSDGYRLSFAPDLPEEWEGYSFQIKHLGRIISVSIDTKEVNFRLISGEPTALTVYEHEYKIDETGFSIPLTVTAERKMA